MIVNDQNVKDRTFSVGDRQKIAKDVYRLELRGDCRGIRRPGQFVHLSIPERFLRRPISISDWDEDRLVLVFKVVGYGTEYLSRLSPGEAVRGLLPLGNGYDIQDAPSHPFLLGGGLGVPPLYGLCKRLLAEGKHPSVLLGFNTSEDVFYVEAFRSLGVPVSVATADGSYGERGLVTHLLLSSDPSVGQDPGRFASVPAAASASAPASASVSVVSASASTSGPKASDAYVFCCGPEPMLRAVHSLVRSGQFSLETRMGCGFGACMGCSLESRSGMKRICKEGPVFVWEDLPWQ